MGNECTTADEQSPVDVYGHNSGWVLMSLGGN